MPLELRRVALIGLLLLLGAVTARAEDPAAAPQRQLDQLRGEVGNLHQQAGENVTSIQKIQQDIKVALPAEANAAPQTIGQHVAVVEKDLADTKKSLADNLGVHIHGMVDASYEYNMNHPGLTSSSRINQFRAFDTDANGFELSQFNLHIDRTVEGGVGFVTDINFGKTAEVLRGATRYSNSSTPPGTDEVDPTQAYLTYTVPVGTGINLSVGKFVTLLGAEVIKTYNNFNYNESNDFIFTLGIPFTHTGVRANYAFSDKIGLTLGVNNGWDDVADNNDGKSIEGSLSLTPTSTLSILLNGMYGPEQLNHGNSKRGAFDPVVTWKTPLPGFTLVGEYLYAHEDNPVAVSPLLTGANQGVNPLFFLAGCPLGPCVRHGVDWQGAAGYLIYDLTDKAELVARGEFFRDSDGVRTGIRQSLAEMTFTLNYKVANGLLGRLEYRHDESNASPFLTNRGTPISLMGPGIGPVYTISGQDTLEGAMIYSF
jgi:hypothetical protein